LDLALLFHQIHLLDFLVGDLLEEYYQFLLHLVVKLVHAHLHQNLLVRQQKILLVFCFHLLHHLLK
jgi:hypothetical protein